MAFSDLQKFDLGEFTFESGTTLPRAFLGYRTIGTWEPGKRVLVIPTAYSGDTQSTAWFAVPLARPDVFIVCIAMFGSAESSSPSNTPAPFDGPRFPGVAVRDNAVAQRTLLDSLWPEAGKIDVVGWSMGAAQAFHWSVLYPEKVRKFVALCGSARTARHNWTFLEGIKRALLCDPEFCEGDYKRLGKEPKKGLEAFGTVYCSYGTSQAYFRNERWKELGVPSLEVYISVWVQHFSSKDANDLLCQLGAWQGSDVSKGGDLAETLGKVEAECLIMPCETDMYFPPADSEIEVKLIGSNARFLPIRSEWGHMSASGQSVKDAEWIVGKVKEFLWG